MVLLDEHSIRRWIEAWDAVKKQYPSQVCHPIIASSSIVGAYVKDVDGTNIVMFLLELNLSTNTGHSLARSVLTQLAASPPPDQLVAFPEGLDLSLLLKAGWQQRQPNVLSSPSASVQPPLE